MYPDAEFEGKAVHRKPLFVNEDYFFYFFHSKSTDRGDDLIGMHSYLSGNLATCDWKILKLYEYEASEYRYEANCE